MDIFPLNKSFNFPDPFFANDKGLLAYGGDLHPSRLMMAYTKGIFPWYNEDDPILWWSPNPRSVIKLEDFKVSKSLEKKITKNIFKVEFDKNFTQTVIECKNIKRPKQKGTWISDEIIDAYTKLHDLGFAHSFEAYFDDKLVGGGYGINIGDIFCGESMFAKKDDASKVALFYLVQRLKESGFSMIDCQIHNPHLESLGAKQIKREEFLNLVKLSVNNPKIF
jgi:leucyl/phenylalanyl-tRNA--protein transferase